MAGYDFGGHVACILQHIAFSNFLISFRLDLKSEFLVSHCRSDFSVFLHFNNGNLKKTQNPLFYLKIFGTAPYHEYDWYYYTVSYLAEFATKDYLPIKIIHSTFLEISFTAQSLLHHPFCLLSTEWQHSCHSSGVQHNVHH